MFNPKPFSTSTSTNFCVLAMSVVGYIERITTQKTNMHLTIPAPDGKLTASPPPSTKAIPQRASAG